jgi:hypothetical protein
MEGRLDEALSTLKRTLGSGGLNLLTHSKVHVSSQRMDG